MHEMILGEYIWKSKLDLDIDTMISAAYRIEENNPGGRKISNMGGYQNLAPVFDEDCETLAAKIEQSANNLIPKDLELYDNFEFRILELWVNINRSGDKNIPHVHVQYDFNRLTNNSVLSGTYYVQVPPKSGGIVFIKEKFNNTNFPIQAVKNPNNRFWAKQHQFSPDSNDCLFWFSDLKHYVEENDSSQDRISFSFNLQLVQNVDK